MTRKLRTLEVSVPYRPRIAGTVSKLQAFRDGRRILGTILAQGLRRDPARVILVYLVRHRACFSCPHRTGPQCEMSGLRWWDWFGCLLIVIAWIARGVAQPGTEIEKSVDQKLSRSRSRAPAGECGAMSPVLPRDDRRRDHHCISRGIPGDPWDPVEVRVVAGQTLSP